MATVVQHSHIWEFPEICTYHVSRGWCNHQIQVGTFYTFLTKHGYFCRTILYYLILGHLHMSILVCTARRATHLYSSRSFSGFPPEAEMMKRQTQHTYFWLDDLYLFFFRNSFNFWSIGKHELLFRSLPRKCAKAN